MTNQIYIFIDGSYFCFYRYHSLLTWWRNAYPDQLEVLNNPYENELFVEKFKKIFIESVQNIPKKLKIHKSIKPIIIVGKDCKRQNIWRNELFPNYKGTRNKDDSFMGAPFFKMVYEEDLFIKGGATKILSHPKLEADDCIALTVKHYLNIYPNCLINIITSDKDYLQLIEPRVQISNLQFKSIQKTDITKECELFCKIVSGDISDNIPSVFPKCGPKTALKYFNDREAFEKKLKENNQSILNYNLNTNLISFQSIPEQLSKEFIQNNII
jgi:5'-3' exonuclease